MEINRNNFEAFFLDYWEGNLSAIQKESLAIFLENNPDLRDQFTDYQEVSDVNLVADESIVYNSKNLLKKNEFQPVGNINQKNWETFVIASLEDDLTPKEREAFRKFVLLNPQISKIIDQYRKVYLKPDYSVVFPDKGEIKKSISLSFPSKIVRWSMAAAAAIILGFTIFSVYFNDKVVGKHDVEITQQTKENKANPVDNHKEEQFLQNPASNTRLKQVADKTREIIPENSNSEVANMNLQEISKQLSKERTPFQRDLNQFPAHMNSLAVAQLVCEQGDENVIPEDRNQYASLFDDLMLRDAIQSEIDLVANKEKTTVGRIISNWGNKIINVVSSEEVNNSLVVQLASKGKEKITGIPGLIPVYRANESEGKKETFLAISENFSIYRSKATEAGKSENAINEP